MTTIKDTTKDTTINAADTTTSAGRSPDPMLERCQAMLTHLHTLAIPQKVQIKKGVPYFAYSPAMTKQMKKLESMILRLKAIEGAQTNDKNTSSD